MPDHEGVAADAGPRDRVTVRPYGDRALLVEVAAQSVPMMRGLWDAYEAKSREHVLAHGVIANEVDRAAFQRSVEPLIDDYRRDAALDRQYRAIRELA